ncbi:MAG: patatin-like phospholipase family protein [bacterium]
MLGGGVPNVGFQFGVARALQDWGFEIPTGCLGDGEQRVFDGTTLNPIIGSSSGSFFSICLAMGYDMEDILGRTGKIKPITESIIKDRLEATPWALLKRLYTSRRKYTRLKSLVKSSPSMYEHIINTYYPIWKMDALEEYMRDELLGGCDFGTLRARLMMLAVAQEQRLTFIFSDVNRSRKGGTDYMFQDKVPPWEAAAGSMCLPPYYKPYRLPDPPDEIKPPGGDTVVLIDGETRDPFTTDAAEDSGADLIFVSSFYRIMEYSADLGHIDDFGILPVMWQERAQSKDAKKFRSIENRESKEKALDLFRDYLQEHCPGECEEAIQEMETILDYRENMDVVEIQAQDYEHEELTYPYWDPFSLNEDVLKFQFDAGYEVAASQLEKHVQPIEDTPDEIQE